MTVQLEFALQTKNTKPCCITVQPEHIRAQWSGGNDILDNKTLEDFLIEHMAFITQKFEQKLTKRPGGALSNAILVAMYEQEQKRFPLRKKQRKNTRL